MKNLILKSSFHEKLKLLIIPMMLLTLGVGQMWAGQGYNGETHVYLNVDGTTKYYKVSTESWSTGSSLPGTWGGVLKNQTFNNVLNIQIKGGAVGGWTENGGNISGNLYYKVTNNTTTPSSGWTTVGNINANYTTKSGNNCFRYKNDYSVNVTPTTPGTYYLHIKITDGDSNNRTSYVKLVVPSFTVAGTGAVLGSDWDVTDTDNDMTFSSGTTYTLTKSNVTLSTGTTYECKVALNHSWGTSYPGSNKQFTVAANGHYNVTFSFNASTKAVDVTTTRLYAVIYNDNGKTGGSVPATSYHAEGATVTVASNSGSLAKTNYTFDGWNENSSGTGTNYAAGSGQFTMGSSDKNLYAKWNENMSTVSLVSSPANKGTFTVGGSTVTNTTAGASTTRSVTAVPIDGYHFVSWDITGGATISSPTTNPTTITGNGAGEAATLTATFEADNVYSLTVAKGTGISAVTGSTSNITAGQSIAITATVATGYTWSTWTKSGAGTLSTFTAGTKNQTVTVGTAGDITLTASATEKMTTVTINVSPSGAGTLTVGGSAFTPGNTTTAGVTTSRAVVATAANDYTFDNWTTGGNATGTASTNTYTLKGNGNGSTGTLTANFTPIPVKLLYGSGTPLNSPTDGGAMSYDATEHAYYKDVTTNSSPYYFRFDYNSNSEQYSGDWNGYPDVKEAKGDGTKVDCNQTVKEWGDKASIKYTGVSGSSIRIWFDFQNKKAWVTETTYTVSVAASAGGSVSPSSVTGVGATTASGDITATPSTGYVFTGWTLPDGTSAAAGYTASSNPIHINATAASKTITANFAAATAFIEGRFHITNASRNGTWTNTFSSGNWDENSTRIKFTWDGTNNRYELHTYAQPKELSTQISSYNPYFYVKESSSSSALENVTSYWSSTSQTLTAAGIGNKKSLVSSGTFHNDYLRFNSTDESGYTVLYFDESGVWYELEQTLKYDANGGTGSAPATAYYLKGTNATAAAANTFSRIGYTFDRWRTGATSGTYYAANANVPMNSNITLYAQWNANNYTITLDKQSGATGYGGGGTVTNPTVTYDGDLPALSGTMPSGTGSYGFMGFYSKAGGAGTKFINADGTWAVTDVTDTVSNGKWVKAGGITLYAYYKQVEIESIDLSAATISPSQNLTVTAVIVPSSVSGIHVEWRLLHANGNAYSPQPIALSTNGNEKTFTVPATSAQYLVEAKLRLGSTHGSGDVLDTKTQSFRVAGDHNVTVEYKCGDQVIKASDVVTGKPLDWTEITAPDIVGYSFSKWKEGDGITIEGAVDGEISTQTINFKATYDGKLTAIYTTKRIIYFNNTLGWGSVYVYFYKNDSYWQTVSPYKGSGANTSFTWTNTPYSEGKHGQMQPVSEGSNIYYFDAEAAGVNESYDDVVFTEHQQHGYDYFYETNAVRRGDYKSTTMPMFVPLAGQEPDVHNKTNYYNSGYWMNYPENTGYTLYVYNWYTDAKGSPMKTYRFPYSEGMTMPLKLDVEFNDAAKNQYWFMIYRNDGTYLSTNFTFKQGYNNEQAISSTENKMELVTSAPGTYHFTLTYHQNGGGHDYFIDVDYPIASNDYRIIYKDNATWSHNAHGGNYATWYHPSDIIRQIEGAATEAKKDTVSFFVSKASGANAAMKFQKASVTNEGVVTWSDVEGGAISIPSSVSTSGVYNFIVTQPVGGGSISLEKAEPYTGSYYIRTDCANSKWDNFRSDPDHLMTYSDYSITHGGYSHYYTHWVKESDTGRKNVKFVIANDYSPYISDTLAREDNTDPAWANIAYYIEEGGDLKRDANVRFMWNQSTNKISRAYVDGAQEEGTDFLQMVSDDNKILNPSTGAVQAKTIFSDNGNWIYEANVKAIPNAGIRLKSIWGETNTIVQYFRGTESTPETLITGSGSEPYDIRVIYDFKTNRLVAAWLPSDMTITSETSINADIMFIREHQGDIAQLTFNGGNIKDIKTAYAVLRFNKWTLNNKDKESHTALAAPLSRYERDIFYVSFPFSVSMEEVFGFGTYGTHWIIEEYDGATRAAKGYWQESPPNWKYVTNRKNKFFEPNKGYIIALDLDELGESSSVWTNTDKVELYFPSYGTMPTITSSSVTYNIPEHLCTINRSEEIGGDGEPLGEEYDRRVKDSHWNVLSVPTYINTSNLTFANTTWITEESETTIGPNFVYEWNSDDNTLTPVAGVGYAFRAMHAYLAQYCGNITWTTSVSPSLLPRRNPAYHSSYKFRLELMQNEKAVDQTFVKLTDNENVTTGFEFNYDMSKEINKGKANIYTLIGKEVAAGNCLPLTDQTTVVPVGVKITEDSEYIFTMPDGTEGIGVTLVDNETGVRTNLALSDYAATLPAGTYNERFVLEISPIEQIVTKVEEVNDENGDAALNGVCKKLVDGVLYIVKDGKVFDARGARIQ